jgi:pimeloyl-ACP methyl ester carboxylesterase
MNQFMLDGKRIAYHDSGQGVPVVLVHCSSASHREWSSLGRQLKGDYRVLAPDLIGYGQSDGWPSDQPFDPHADVNVVIRLLELAGEPAHLLGHSYGGAVALEVARLHPHAVRSLTLVEPVAFHLLRLGGRDKEWHAIARQGRSIALAVSQNDCRKAAAIFMGFWIGRLRWWLMPAKVKQSIVDTMGKVAKEFETIHKLQHTYSDYDPFRVPVRLIMGTRTRAPARAVVSELQKLLPSAELKQIKGAGHMSPFTHESEFRLLFIDFLDKHAT